MNATLPAWKSRYLAWGSVPVDVPDAGLGRAADQRLDMEYGRFSPGFGTIVAHMRWMEDGSTLFEGLTGSQTLTKAPGMTDAEQAGRVVAHWPGFVAAQRDRHEREAAYKRACPEPLPQGERRSTVTLDGCIHLLLGRHLEAALRDRRDIDFGPLASGAPRDALLAWREDGSVAFTSALVPGEDHPRDVHPADLARYWSVFCEAVSRSARARHAADRDVWERGLAAARTRPPAA